MKTFTQQRTRLRTWLALIFVALAIPSATLLVRSFNQLQYEAIYVQRSLAEAFADQAQRQFIEWIASEEQRPTTDYSFLVISGESYVQRSPLASLTPATVVPGVVGFFQVDANGNFATPLLPASNYNPADLELSASELDTRLRTQASIRTLLESSTANQSPAQTIRLESVSSQNRDRSNNVTSESDTTPSNREERGKKLDALESELTPAEAPDSVSAAQQLTDAGSFRAKSDLPDESRLAQATIGDEALEKDKVDRDMQIASTATRNQQIFDQLSSSPGAGAKELVTEQESFEVSLRRNAAAPDASSMQAPTDIPAPSIKTKSQATKRIEKSRSVLQQESEDKQVLERRISTFDSSVDPFRMDRLGPAHWVIFRNVWTDEQRFVQGFIVAIDDFMDALVGKPFATSTLASSADLIITANKAVLHRHISTTKEYANPSALSDSVTNYTLPNTDVLSGDVLLRKRMPDPGGQLEILISAASLPYGGVGSLTLLWTGGVLAVVLCAGFWWIYRLGLKQIDLAEQQHNFVSAVSHELKTPLTSIRMYGEILKAGWSDEAKRKTYYEHIYHESERLTRLINNVLSLARISSNSQTTVVAKAMLVQDLIRTISESTANAITQSGRSVQTLYDESVDDVSVLADLDAFAQVMINLVDNAIKFGGPSNEPIQLGSRSRGDYVEFWVRDFGPGIDPAQLKKIFRMFYRIENELTRETRGTGIGLALVSELVDQMHGKIDVVNCDPGAEFRVRLQITPE